MSPQAGACCPALQHPQGHHSRGLSGKGLGTHWCRGDKPAGSQLWDHQGLPSTWGGPAPPKWGEEQCWQCPSWALSPALHGHSSRKDGAGGCRGRAAPQMREALPAGERKPCSPHYLGSFAPCLSRPAWAVSPCPQGSLFLFPWFTVQAFQRDELPSTEGVLQMAPRLSVRLGCEDEEPVFLLADPLHELVDSTDGTRLGPQRTVTYVELKGAGDPSQEVFTWAREVDVLQGA